MTDSSSVGTMFMGQELTVPTDVLAHIGPTQC